MIIQRLVTQQLINKLEPCKAVLLYGPRRVGKTTLLKEVASRLASKEKVSMVSGEIRIIQDDLSSRSIERLARLIGDNTLFIIDEAQYVPNIGLALKLLVDHLPKLKVIASGSASFDLAQKVGEPLTGRKKTVCLYPIAATEIIATHNLTYYRETLEDYLIFGNYPEVFQLTSAQQKKEYLRELVESYLFKDILSLEQVRNPRKLRDLLALLAFQIGREVSLLELGRSLEMSKDTVSRYLDLLEKSFIIVNIRGFSRNLRKEVSKTSRYYFYDNGVRNAIINNFNRINLRDDVGMLWENYLIIERLKKQAYSELLVNNYFWRTYDQKEIDWVEERGGQLFGYEISWKKKKAKCADVWLNTYSNAQYQQIDQENFLTFIT